jgi:hypothetical protein
MSEWNPIVGAPCAPPGASVLESVSLSALGPPDGTRPTALAAAASKVAALEAENAALRAERDKLLATLANERGR